MNTAAAQIDFTSNDIYVGSRLYDVLVQFAQAHPQQHLTYTDLLALARQAHPCDGVISRAVPIGIGRKLLFVEAFCRATGCPNLACLAVNSLSDTPGSSYTNDWDKEKSAVAAFDWSDVNLKMTRFAADARAALNRRRSNAKQSSAQPVVDQAADQVYRYYKENREHFPNGITTAEKEAITRLVHSNIPVEQAFQRVLTR